MAALGIIAVSAAILYLTVRVNPKYASFALSLRIPRLAGMLIAAFAIGSATVVFQTIINNRIVTPCLLGMNSLYTFVHTAVAFFLTTGSQAFSNRNLSFAVDLAIMSAASLIIYGWLFDRAKNNILYILLIGTVLANLFGSAQSALVRVMDPNEYDALLATLVASFSRVNSDIIWFSVMLLAFAALLLKRELALLDVIALGKDRAISLGVDYDKTIKKLLLGVTIFIAAATALVGPISFLGLIIANLAREIFKTFRHSWLAAGAALVGVAALVGGQLLVEHVFVYSVPASVFITFSGGIYFLFLLLRKRGA
jgi:iron complex transport system permease protein